MFATKNLLMLVIRNALISFIVILGVIVSIFFLKNKIESITNTIALNHKLEAEFKKRIELSSVLNHNIETVGDNEILIDKAFMSSDNISEFINTLDELGSNYKVIQTYRFGSPVTSINDGSYQISSIPYSLNITTDLITFSKYLKDFEKLPYFTKIDSLDISSQDKIGWMGISTFSIKSTLLTKSTQ